MIATYIQPGGAISYQNRSEADIQVNEVIALGACVAVAGDTIKTGDTGTLMLTGVWEMETDGSEFAVGDAVYYDPATGKVTAGESSEFEDDSEESENEVAAAAAVSLVLAGIAVTEATASDTHVAVKIG